MMPSSDAEEQAMEMARPPMVSEYGQAFAQQFADTDLSLIAWTGQDRPEHIAEIFEVLLVQLLIEAHMALRLASTAGVSMRSVE
jgi:hypothetical protein